MNFSTSDPFVANPLLEVLPHEGSPRNLELVATALFARLQKVNSSLELMNDAGTGEQERKAALAEQRMLQAALDWLETQRSEEESS